MDPSVLHYQQCNVLENEMYLLKCRSWIDEKNVDYVEAELIKNSLQCDAEMFHFQANQLLDLCNNSCLSRSWICEKNVAHIL